MMRFIVLIPLKSGQVWNNVFDAIGHPEDVLIPLKSGQVWNLPAFGNQWRANCLNPFEIRAGLEQEKRK